MSAWRMNAGAAFAFAASQPIVSGVRPAVGLGADMRGRSVWRFQIPNAKFETNFLAPASANSRLRFGIRNLAVGSWVKPALAGVLFDELAEFLRARGAPAYRAKQVFDWLYKKRVTSYDAMTDLPLPVRDELAAEFDLAPPDVVRVLGSKDTTQKFLFRLRDSNLIESVLIPASPALYGESSDRRTICVSSQVGCAYGCKFCASGLDGWTRNLDAGEIVQQLLAVEEKSGEKIDNVVFMGMGEPLANLKNLRRALCIINQPWGLGIGARHITVSTSGLAPQIRELAEDPTQFRL